MSHSDLKHLTIKQLIKIFHTIPVIERAKLVTQHLKNHVVINNDTLYKLDTNNIYVNKGSKKIDELILIEISTYLNDSYNLFTEDEQNEIKTNYESSYKKVFGDNSFVKSFIAQMKPELNIDVKFNVYSDKIHYINGYMDLRMKEFKNRVIGEDYITKSINRDYIESTEEQKTKIMNIISKIYTNEDDKECMLRIISRGIAGLAQNSQVNTFLIGLGSSGKSLLMKLIKTVFTVYYKELDSNTFSEKNTKIDKTMNSYLLDPQIRISCCNEMQDSRVNNSLFKTFIEGELSTTKLYEDGAKDVIHNSALFFLCNTMPNLKFDSGIDRRIECCEHKSKFVGIKDKNLIDESKNIFLGNDFLIRDITEQNLLNAFADIIFDKSKKLISNEIHVEYSDNFKESKNLIIECDNPFKSFIIQNLIIDNNDENLKIGKEDMLNAYKEFSKNNFMKYAPLLVSLKSNGLIYDSSKLRVNGEKGVWKYCRFRNDFDKNLNADEQPMTNSEPNIKNSLFINSDIIEENNNLKKEIEELKQQMAILLKKNEELDVLKDIYDTF